MEYRRFFDDAISKLKGERRYRVFADLARDAEAFPRAAWRRDGGTAPLSTSSSGAPTIICAWAATRK